MNCNSAARLLQILYCILHEGQVKMKLFRYVGVFSCSGVCSWYASVFYIVWHPRVTIDTESQAGRNTYFFFFLCHYKEWKHFFLKFPLGWILNCAKIDSNVLLFVLFLSHSRKESMQEITEMMKRKHYSSSTAALCNNYSESRTTQ